VRAVTRSWQLRNGTLALHGEMLDFLERTTSQSPASSAAPAWHSLSTSNLHKEQSPRRAGSTAVVAFGARRFSKPVRRTPTTVSAIDDNAAEGDGGDGGDAGGSVD